MTRTDNIAAIRAACIKANPEIEGKSGHCICGHEFWCHAQHNVSKKEFENRKSDLYKPDCTHCVCTNYHQLIGRPIRLADVLLAIGDIPHTHFLKDDTYGIHGDAAKIVLDWRLRTDDLEQQSDTTLSFIASLL
jgi:hypothetical protein